MTTKLHQLSNLGQAIWLDYIRRSFITSGELQKLIDQGVRGVTSNPAIFEKAIAGSDDYDTQMRELVTAGRSVNEIYEALAVQDIQQATDLFRPLYDETGGADGFVSLEVSPDLANDTTGTINEGRRYFSQLKRPNLMIKVPATAEGIPAIRQLISEGVNVNITLMFSMEHYNAVAEAYIAGLEDLVERGGDPAKVSSVASFFISRVDTKLDPQVEAHGAPELKSKIAIANAKLVYQRFKEVFSGERWERLAAKGARVQRPLWASTSTKDPSLPDTLYVDTLIGADTVNTVPPETLNAYLDHGVVALTVEDNLDEVQAQIARLAQIGIDLSQAGEELQNEGVDKFVKPFTTLLKSIEQKRELFQSSEWPNLDAKLLGYQNPVDNALKEIARDGIVARIWNGDHTVWRPAPDEIANRLGWLRVAEELQAQIGDIQAFVDEVRAAGYTQAVLLGMGGSSLAPEVFRKTFGVASGYLDLAVLDSTDPGAVLNIDRRFDPAKTLYIVSTKSGGTIETLSFFKYFYNRTVEKVGVENAGAHFIAITDPGSTLETLMQQYHVRRIFLNNPDIGGRYSALSHFGLVPAALLGVDLAKLLERARAMMDGCTIPTSENPGAWLGVILGELAKAGRDKVTLILPPALASFGDWVEQLIAESTGKDGQGILPVVGETLGTPDVYGHDRLFAYLHLEGDDSQAAAVQTLEDAGHPLVMLNLHDAYDLGGQFFLWEFAIAVAGYRLGIQPFDQPNVESAKILARKMVAAYAESGALPPQTVLLAEDGITAYGDLEANNLAAALASFLISVQPGDYISIQAYITPDEAADAQLAVLRNRLRTQTHLATTVGYGPRFLHSTGQLHKGDAGNGLFIQFTSDAVEDVSIPDQAGSSASSMTFGILKLAQALGDGEALRQNNRRLLRLHLGTDVIAGLERVLKAL